MAAVTMAIRTPAVAQSSRLLSGSDIFSPMSLPLRAAAPVAMTRGKLQVRASSSNRENAVAGLTAAALAAALVLPDIAEAAQPGLSGSLKNFLLSILYGGVVAVGITGAVAVIANFDPVKRS